MMLTQSDVHVIVEQVAIHTGFIKDGDFTKIGNIPQLVEQSIYKVLTSREFLESLNASTKNTIQSELYK